MSPWPADPLRPGGVQLLQQLLALLPFYVAERATATRVSEVDIP
jgi:hypothetical protein